MTGTKRKLVALSAIFTLHAGMMPSDVFAAPPSGGVASHTDTLADRAMAALVTSPDPAAGPSLAFPEKPKTIADIARDLAKGDGHIQLFPSPITAPVIYKDMADEIMLPVIEALVEDRSAHADLENFLDHQGKIHPFIGYAGNSYGLYTDFRGHHIYLSADISPERRTIIARHELWHYMRNQLDGLDGSDDMASYHFTDFFRYRLFDEALAQANATDFAYQLYLKGKPQYLQDMLDAPPAIDRKTGEASVQYFKIITLAYLAALHQLDTVPENFVLKDYPLMPSSEALPYEVRRAKAQAAAFEAWLTSGVMAEYAEAGSRYLEARYKDVGISWMNAEIGKRYYDESDARREMAIDGGSFYAYVKPEIMTDAYMLNILPPDIAAKAPIMEKAARFYNDYNVRPFVTITPPSALYFPKTAGNRPSP